MSDVGTDAEQGYPIELLKNKSDLNDHIICGICCRILKEAVQHVCGHRFCAACVNKLLRGPAPHYCPSCPPDSKDAHIRSISPDFAGRKAIKILKVKCLNSSCHFEGTLFDYITNHQYTCDHRRFSCPNCGKPMKHEDLENHSLRDCAERTLTCRWCNVQLVHKNMKQHNATCVKFEVLCLVCKKVKLPRDEMKTHQDPENGDCPRRRRCCKFQMVGCEFTAPQEQMPGHHKNNNQEHLNLLLTDYVITKNKLHAAEEKLKQSESNAPCTSAFSKRYVSALLPTEDVHKKHGLERNGNKLEDWQHNSASNDSDDVVTDSLPFITRYTLNHAESMVGESNGGDVWRKTFNTQQRRSGPKQVAMATSSTHQDVVDLQRSQSKLMKNHHVINDVIEVLNNEMEKIGNQVASINHQIPQIKLSNEATQKHLQTYEQSSALNYITLTEQNLRLQTLEKTSNNGILVWKITDFNQKRRDAISGKQPSVYSPCFFSTQYGYRVCCRIYPNGDGMGKGTHISIFFVIMKGRYDALLRWPFQQKVNFILLDQNNVEHVVDAFRPDNKSNSFRRPTSDMNIASGCPLFISISDLENSPHAYVKDDNMFIKIIIEQPDIAF